MVDGVGGKYGLRQKSKKLKQKICSLEEKANLLKTANEEKRK